MRLISQLDRVERGVRKRAAAKRAASTAWGVCWTSAEVVLDRELEPGEYRAVDVHVTEEMEGGCIASTRERVTRDPSDRGLVYGISGAVIGEVAGDGSGVLHITRSAG